MVAYTRDEIISATDLARNVSATLNNVVKHVQEKIAISKNNKLEAVIIDIEEYERLKEAYEEIEKQFEENKVKYREEVSKYTYPVFILEDVRPELVATSIIVLLDNVFYLVTASHVITEYINKVTPLYISSDDKIISVDGEVISSTSEDEENDNFDIGFIELDNKFIEDNRIVAFHVNEDSIADDNTEKYFGLLCGYPATPNMNDSRKAFRKDPSKYEGRPYWYSNIITQGRKNENIFMDYGKNIKGEKPKRLDGMSGCGMWACHIARGKLQLAGIFIEHHTKDGDIKKGLYATPIREVVQFIRKSK